MRTVALFCAFVLLGTSVSGTTPFEIETVDTQALTDLGTYASLALDSHDNPHIAYYDATSQDLKYARKLGASWAVEVVDSGNLTGFYASLALDANDAPHIVYYNAEAGFLRYAEKTSGAWMTETVPDIGIYGSWCSITVDADGFPVVAYRDDFEDGLSVAKKDGGGWGPIGIDGTPGAGFHTDITIGRDNLPYVSHYRQSTTDLRLAWRATNGTAISGVDVTADDVGAYNSVVVGADGSVHISYHDETNGDLKYATSLNGLTWGKEIVDDGGLDDVGEWTSIALDATGQPHISYYDVSNQQLKYATLQGGAWAIQKVDLSTQEQGQYSSLALDSQGNPHIAYYNHQDNTLRYASGAVKLIAPTGGETWAVGSLQEVSWLGAGGVDVLLSTNGSDFDHALLTDVFSSPAQLRVPHAPTRFARVQVRRSNSFSSSASDSFFTIDASVILSSLKATIDGNVVALHWKTQPGPEAGIRYRVQRSDEGGTFFSLHEGLLSAREYVDQAAPAGALYRVLAVNGVGGEVILGEVRALPAIAAGRLLTVTPNPIQSGDAMVLFRSHSGVPIRLQVFDVRGALVRTIYSGHGTSNIGWVRWDGTDRNGVRAHSGVYFVRLSSPAGLAATERVVLVR